jgi:hypothetical protein
MAPSLLVQVKAMQRPVQDRRDDECGRDDEDQSGVERVDPGEQFSCCRQRRVHRTHAAEQHRRVQEPVDPGQAFEMLVAEHADPERQRQQRHGHCHMTCDATQEGRPRQEWLMPGFVHDALD